MSFDWNIIGEKVNTLYQEMEYHPEYNIEKFMQDFEIEKKRECLIQPLRSEDALYHRGDERWLLWLHDVIEFRRPILTKLFFLTNGVHNVDTLLEYCDHFNKSYLNKRANDVQASLLHMDEYFIKHIFKMILKNVNTERVLEEVWEMLFWDAFGDRIVVDLFIFLEYPSVGPLAMVVMADADLNAAVQAFDTSYLTSFEVSRILVQEPIKEQLLNTWERNGSTADILSKLYVFRNTPEALGNLNSGEFGAVSIWSENIIAAKKFAANTKVSTIWINAHGVLAPCLYSLIYPRSYARLCSVGECISSYKAKHSPKTSIKTYDLFYGGKWQIPALGEYWINDDGVSFAQATDKDLLNCANNARGASKLWSSKKLGERVKTMRNFATRLKANGESEHANMVLQCLQRPLQSRTTLSIVRDGEAEITSTSEPVGVVLIAAKNQKTLFAELVIACVTGNAVIVLLNGSNSVSFAPYCDWLATCGFPPGVISCLYTTDASNLSPKYQIADAVLPEYDNSLYNLYANFSDFATDQNTDPMHDVYCIFNTVTKTKSVWLQCG